MRAINVINAGIDTTITLLAARTLLDFMGGVTMANNDVMTWDRNIRTVDSNIPNADRNILAVDRSISEKSLVSVRTPEFEFNEVLGERVLRYVPWVGEAFGASRAQKVGALAVQIGVSTGLYLLLSIISSLPMQLVKLMVRCLVLVVRLGVRMWRAWQVRWSKKTARRARVIPYADLTLPPLTLSSDIDIWLNALHLVANSRDMRLTCLANLDSTLRSKLEDCLLRNEPFASLQQIELALQKLLPKTTPTANPWLDVGQCEQAPRELMLMFAGRVASLIQATVPHTSRTYRDELILDRFVTGLRDQ